MDRGVWQATVHGVAKSGTWLKQLSMQPITGTKIFITVTPLLCIVAYKLSLFFMCKWFVLSPVLFDVKTPPLLSVPSIKSLLIISVLKFILLAIHWLIFHHNDYWLYAENKGILIKYRKVMRIIIIKVVILKIHLQIFSGKVIWWIN